MADSPNSKRARHLMHPSSPCPDAPPQTGPARTENMTFECLKEEAPWSGSASKKSWGIWFAGGGRVALEEGTAQGEPVDQFLGGLNGTFCRTGRFFLKLRAALSTMWVTSFAKPARRKECARQRAPRSAAVTATGAVRPALAGWILQSWICGGQLNSEFFCAAPDWAAP